MLAKFRIIKEVHPDLRMYFFKNGKIAVSFKEEVVIGWSETNIYSELERKEPDNLKELFFSHFNNKLNNSFLTEAPTEYEIVSYYDNVSLKDFINNCLKLYPLRTQDIIVTLKNSKILLSLRKQASADEMFWLDEIEQIVNNHYSLKGQGLYYIEGNPDIITSYRDHKVFIHKVEKPSVNIQKNLTNLIY